MIFIAENEDFISKNNVFETNDAKHSPLFLSLDRPSVDFGDPRATAFFTL